MEVMPEFNLWLEGKTGWQQWEKLGRCWLTGVVFQPVAIRPGFNQLGVDKNVFLFNREGE